MLFVMQTVIKSNIKKSLFKELKPKVMAQKKKKKNSKVTNLNYYKLLLQLSKKTTKTLFPEHNGTAIALFDPI